jgi:hypothetical protein
LWPTAPGIILRVLPESLEQIWKTSVGVKRRSPMSDGVSNRDASFRMMLQSRGAGRYGYVIGRPDLEEWGEPSLETFATVAEAHEAGRRAMKARER